MNRKALLCAQKSEDKNAIGQSLILDSNIRLSQYENWDMMETSEKNEICNNRIESYVKDKQRESKEVSTPKFT